jgi:hypothetical protein
MLHCWEEFWSVATKWHPNKAEMNRLCASLEEKFNQLWTDFLLLLEQRDRGQLLKKRRLTLNKL